MEKAILNYAELHSKTMNKKNFDIRYTVYGHKFQHGEMIERNILLKAFIMTFP